MIESRSEITDIYTRADEGAYGDPSKLGRWVQGKGPDGKYYKCTHRRQKKTGTIIVSATYLDQKTRKTYVSHFLSVEWTKIIKFEGKRAEQQCVCNETLRERREIARKQRVADFLMSCDGQGFTQARRERESS